MATSLTAQRMRLAREIKTTLTDAKERLKDSPNNDERIRLEDLVNALEQRLERRRTVVLSARAASTAKWLEARRRKARITPVWGFRAGYDPNEMHDRCEICLRSDRWVSRPAPAAEAVAWLCSACCVWPQEASPQIAPRPS